MLYMYFIVNGLLTVARGYGPDHLSQVYAAKGELPPRVFLGTQEALTPEQQADVEKQYGLKSAPVDEIPLPDYRFRPNQGANAKYQRRLAEGKANDAAKSKVVAPAK